MPSIIEKKNCTGEFLDDGQYSRNGILRYERIFGDTFVSTGGVETTKVIFSTKTKAIRKKPFFIMKTLTRFLTIILQHECLFYKSYYLICVSRGERDYINI